MADKPKHTLTKPMELDPSAVSDTQLDDLKLERAKDIISCVSKLCLEAKRKDGPAIIDHVLEDIDQVFIAGEEIGKRRVLQAQARKKMIL